MAKKNREAWLNDAAKCMTPWLVEAGADEFAPPHVSVGWPKGSRGKGGTAIGQCWDKAVSGDDKAHVFVSPELTDPVRILDVLLHEMVHVAVGNDCGHRNAFRTVAMAVGLEGKMTATVAGDELKVRLERLNDLLGEFPHPGLNPTKKKKVGSRLLKVACPSCGCIIRMTMKWIEWPGPPICGCGHNMEVFV